MVMMAAMRIDLGPAGLVSGRPGGLGGRASLRGRAGPALAGGFERRWAGSTDIFKVLSNLTRGDVPVLAPSAYGYDMDVEHMHACSAGPVGSPAGALIHSPEHNSLCFVW